MNPNTDIPNFHQHFQDLPDPRMTNKCRHNLIDVITISLLGVLCGADEWTQVECFGVGNEDWLGEFLELPNGIPSQDTFGLSPPSYRSNRPDPSSVR